LAGSSSHWHVHKYEIKRLRDPTHKRKWRIVHSATGKGYLQWELLNEKLPLLSLDFCNPLKHDFKDKHLWIKKATGLGVTEFFLRFMAWLCLRNNDYRSSQMCIVTGPNIDIAIKLIKRMKSLFERKLGLAFANKETVLELNGCRIEAYPSNHIDAYRALDNPKFILLDEADFFRKGEQEDVRHVSERYLFVPDYATCTCIYLVYALFLKDQNVQSIRPCNGTSLNLQLIILSLN
jgi:hypothetical protein